MLEAMVLDKNFRNVFILDAYQSFIWTDKYQSYGDFEFYSSPTPEIIEFIQKDYYIWLRDSEHAMIVDTIELNTDIDAGDNIRITGKSLETILNRRVLIDQSISSPSDEDLQTYIEKIFKKCFGSEAEESRRIPNFIFEKNPDLDPKNFPEDKRFLATGDFFGNDFYTIVETLCKANDLGFKVILEERMVQDVLTNCFVFSFYNGVDRSYDQDTNTYVAFSSNYGNLLSSAYCSSYANYKNFAYCHYEKTTSSEGSSSSIHYMKSSYLGSESPIGLYRRETFVSGSISSDNDTNADPSSLLIQQATDALKETEITEAFDGEVDPYGQYQYGRDFLVGDIVQIADHNGYGGKTRVTAITFSSDSSGDKIYPTFEQMDDSQP